VAANDDVLKNMFIGALHQHQRRATLRRLKVIGMIGLTGLVTAFLLQTVGLPRFVVSGVAASCTIVILVLLAGLRACAVGFSCVSPAELGRLLLNRECAEAICRDYRLRAGVSTYEVHTIAND